MFYQETVINGLLHVRHFPEGNWIPCSAETITAKYQNEKQESAKWKQEAKRLKGIINEYYGKMMQVVNGQE